MAKVKNTDDDYDRELEKKAALQQKDKPGLGLDGREEGVHKDAPEQRFHISGPESGHVPEADDEGSELTLDQLTEIVNSEDELDRTKIGDLIDGASGRSLANLRGPFKDWATGRSADRKLRIDTIYNALVSAMARKGVRY